MTVLTESDSKLGFIGLGLMGKPMARHLRRAGAEVVVHNRSQGAVQELADEGCVAASSPREVAESVGGGCVILMLTNTDSVREVVEGPDGLFAGMQTGLTVIDMGSTALAETRLWREQAVELGGDWVDAPVSGGQKGAIEATLTIFAGGDPARVDAVRPILEVLGSQVTYLGPSGAGQATKLANQIMVAVTIASVSEAFVMCQDAGVDLAAARPALLGGFAASKVLDQHGLRMIDSNFTPGGTATNQLKDLVEACRVAEHRGLDLPMLTANRKLWEEMIRAGLGDLDHSGLYQLYQQKHLPSH